MTVMSEELRRKAAELLTRADELEAEAQAACLHPLSDIRITQGAVSSRAHQEMNIRCTACGFFTHRNLVLHDDIYTSPAVAAHSRSGTVAE